MILKFDQEHLSDREKGTLGDCMAACLKTILQDPLEGYPHPLEDAYTWNYEFWERIEAEHGIILIPFASRMKYQLNVPDFVIVSGPTIRTIETGATHAVVWNNIKDELYHDPNPSRAGLINITTYWIPTNV